MWRLCFSYERVLCSLSLHTNFLGRCFLFIGFSVQSSNVPLDMPSSSRLLDVFSIEFSFWTISNGQVSKIFFNNMKEWNDKLSHSNFKIFLVNMVKEWNIIVINWVIPDCFQMIKFQIFLQPWWRNGIYLW